MPRLRPHEPSLQPYAGELLQLVRAGLRNPVKVEVKVRLLQAAAAASDGGGGGDAAAAAAARKGQATPSSLSLWYMLCEEEQRLPQLLHFLVQKLAAGQKIMCYFLTCAQASLRPPPSAPRPLPFALRPQLAALSRRSRRVRTTRCSDAG